MLKKIIVLMSCAVVFGCGSSDKNAVVTAGDTTGSSASNSWGVPNSATGSWGVPSDGTNSWGAPGSGTDSWGAPTGSGTAAGGGAGGNGGISCTTQTINLPKCATMKGCYSNGAWTYETAVGTYTDPTTAVNACF